MTLRYFIFFLSFALLPSAALGFGFQQVRPCPIGPGNQIDATANPNNEAFCGSCTEIIANGGGSWYKDGAGRNCCCCNDVPAGTAACMT